MLIEETTFPETPALIIPPGHAAAAPTWRAWLGYGHLVFEQAEGATRDAAICALLALLIAQGSLAVGEQQWVIAQQLDDSSGKQWLLVGVVASADGWTFEIMEVC